MAVTFRIATPDELRLALDWAGDEGWNPGQEDAAAFRSADPNGYFVALDDGAPVASISVVNHTDAFAFLGLYICRPGDRGRGIGFALWQHALAHAGGRVVGLDGVPEQQENYRRSGFEPAGSTVRYVGALANLGQGGAREIDESEIDTAVAMEGAVSGVTKPGYIGPWFRGARTRRTLVLGPLGAPSGLLTIRACRRGFKIGPLIADDADAARNLLGTAAILSGDEEVSIDVPETGHVLSEICRDMGMVPGFQTARMYRGTAPVGQQGKVFAVSTLELG